MFLGGSFLISRVNATPSSIDCGLRAYDGTSVIALACEPSGTLTSALRVGKSPDAGIADLVANWHYSEGSGSTAADSSGNNYNLTLSAAAGWSSSGKFGSALSLTGVTNSCAKVAANPVSPSAWTICSWVKFTASSPWMALASFSNGNLLITVNDCSTAGVIAVEAYNGGWGTAVCGHTAVNDGNWHHVCVAQATDNNNSIYVDGILDNTPASTGKSFASWPGTGTQIGTRNTCVDGLFNGLMDDTQMYNRALSSTEITKLYNSGSTIYGVKLVATTDPAASKFRVETSGGVKSIMKY